MARLGTITRTVYAHTHQHAAPQGATQRAAVCSFGGRPMDAFVDGGDFEPGAELPWTLDEGSSPEDSAGSISDEEIISLPPFPFPMDTANAAVAGSPLAPVPFPQPVPPVRAAAKRQRRDYGAVARSADQVEAMMNQDLPPRPVVLNTATVPDSTSGGWVFKETGGHPRLANPVADRWKRSGGAKVATDLPSVETPRVRRRHGYLTPRKTGSDSSPRLRFHQYTRLVPVVAEPGAAGGGGLGVVEDAETSLFHVLAESSHAQQGTPAAGSEASSTSHRITQMVGSLHVEAGMPQPIGKATPLLQLKAAARPAGQITNFVRFEEAGSEVGGIYHSEHGLQMRSGAGDFAEWHSAVEPLELPFEEGSVVGLFSGKISLRTESADMVAVVSRRALCVGSFPGPEQAKQGDIIAYLGRVPVRVREHVVSGETLVPSRMHDGTAVALRNQSPGQPQGSTVAAHVLGIAMSAYVPGQSECDSSCGNDIVGTVDALIAPPSSQHRHQLQQQPPHQELLHQKLLEDPTDDFAEYQRRNARQISWVAMRLCIAALSVGVSVCTLSVYSSYTGGDAQQHCAPGCSDRLTGNPCDDVDCGPGGSCRVTNGSSAPDVMNM
jgi:hypothetical protein